AEETLKQKPKPTVPNFQQPVTFNYSGPFRFKHVTQKDTQDAIASLKPKLSCEIVEMPAKVVKHCALQLAAPIAGIVNKSFALSQFLASLKIANI
ncbi:hypothetical protein J6590_101127, partial [Homalodisca vitripennis]